MSPPRDISLVDVLDERNADDREHLGLASIAAFLRDRGIPTDLHSLLTSDPSAGHVADHHDIVAFSIYPNTVAAVFRFAAELKAARPDLLVGAGGRLATDAAAELLADCPAIDFCVLGDGEIPMLRLAQARRAGTPPHDIPAITTRATSTPRVLSEVDVADLPWPARDYLRASLAHGNPTARLNSSWGCVASCSFCSVNSFFARETEDRRRERDARDRGALPLRDSAPVVRKKWRARTPEDLYREIVALETEHDIRSFVFNDPSFEDPGAIGKARIRTLCELLVAHGSRLAIRCSVRAESFTDADADLLALMRGAGFTHIFIGIEAGNDDDLRAFRKIARVRHNSAVLDLFARSGIDTTMGFIMLNPYSTLTTLRANYDFLVRHRASKVDHFTRKVDVYWRTSLHDRLAKDGLLDPDFSYATPMAYAIRDPRTAEFDRALDPLRDDRVCGEFDGRMYHVSYTLSTLRALDPEGASRPVERFHQVSATAADLLARFFEPLFVDGDPASVERNLPALRTDLERLSRDLRVVGAQIALAPSLRGLLVRSSA
jgi:radical SAM superfamily enzyme YgiQ (UPF0313 family)